MRARSRVLILIAAFTGMGRAVSAQDTRAGGAPPTVQSVERQPGVKSSVQSPHGTTLRDACASCHRADAWKPVRIAPAFKHAERTFPLVGAHERTACMSCHKRLDFRGVSNTCASCHNDPHSGEFGVTCARCHNTRSFVDRGASVRTHQGTRFPLRGAHAIATCEACHARTASGQMQFAPRATTCQSCHLDTFRATRSPSHTAAKFSTDCTSCHTLNTWNGATFDHNTTRFRLTGKHVAATCASCHANGVYTGRATTCVSCHQSAFDASTTPPHRAARFATTCEGCHSTATWTGAPFDHATTRFPLTGGHRAVTCTGCHADNVFVGKSMACASCHEAKARATTNPSHVEARFASTCESCHTTTAWAGARFDHSTTRFPLTGRHVPATCLACHSDKIYAGKPSACQSCHQRDYDATTQPSHSALGFPRTCESCHSTAMWGGAQFDHTTSTRFSLTGAHRALTCRDCHADGVYRGKPMTCVSCHQRAFESTTAPHHQPAGFSTTCESCHTTTQWRGPTYDHNQTRFPLLGRHVAASCLACHNDRVYAGKPSVCASCHQRDFDATTSPNHRTSGYATTCESCHSAAAWKPATFDHSRFPLLGAHRAATCEGCHSDGVYRGRPTACVSCHQSRFDATTRPNHRIAAIPTTCATCHNDVAWSPASFDHTATRFPLAGAHRAVSCAGCHGDGVYTGKSTTCASCHQSVFNATTRPNHRTANFPTTCQTCHSVTAWQPGTFDHELTRFPLVGAHRATTCAACHADGVYTGKSTECVSCHQAVYNGTSKPPHAANGLNTVCQSCHSSTTWLPATFNHAVTRFPLTGAHVSQTCLACHSDGVYRGKSMVCLSCHTMDYNATTNPNHRSAQFPTTCASCHTTTRWTGATFNHDGPWFPIYSGRHRGKWTTCSQCHTNSTNYHEFTCLSCHEHRQSSMDSEHRGRSGYRYESASCYACHPRGDS